MAEGRRGPGQAVVQLAITLAISGLGGLVTGLVMRAAGMAQSRWGHFILLALPVSPYHIVTNDGVISSLNLLDLGSAKYFNGLSYWTHILLIKWPIIYSISPFHKKVAEDLTLVLLLAGGWM